MGFIRVTSRVLLVLILTAVLACSGNSGGGGGTPTTPSPGGGTGGGGTGGGGTGGGGDPGGGTSTGTTVTITTAGVSPRELTVTAGTRVTFINNDTRSHDMASDPHPEHTDCPEVNSVGLLNAGQQRQTGNMVTNRPVCGFHDHDAPNVAGLQGSISIQ